MIIDGKKIAEEMLTKLKNQPKPKRFLAVVLVGNDPSSASFVRQKEKIARELNVDFRLFRFPESIKQDGFRKEVLKIAEHKTCSGVIVQLPLPEHINKQYILNVIPREKDIDVLGERALGAFYADRNPVLPPACGVVEKLLSIVNCRLSVAKVAVIGRGFLVGRPIALRLMDKVAELSVFASSTEDLNNKLKNADVIISGVGKAHLFGPKNLKENALVIDFGYDLRDGKIVGDFNSSSLEIRNFPPKVDAPRAQKFEILYTPTPGGTGPILVAQLFQNFYTLDKNR